MEWGAITFYGTIDLIFIDQKMNGDQNNVGIRIYKIKRSLWTNSLEFSTRQCSYS